MGQGRERDLNPAIVHDGLVIVAPDDATAIYAFDAATGRLAWKTEPIADEVKLTHLLGVAKGNLIATGDRVLWFDVRNGRLVHAWPDNAQAAQGLRPGNPGGRPDLLADEDRDPRSRPVLGPQGRPADQAPGDLPVRGGQPRGRDGYLIVAQANALVVFCQNSRLIDRYRDEIARRPTRPRTTTGWRRRPRRSAGMTWR